MSFLLAFFRWLHGRSAPMEPQSPATPAFEPERGYDDYDRYLIESMDWESPNAP